MDAFLEMSDTTKLPNYKVELHVHLDGSVRLSTVWELAQKKGIKLSAKSLEDLYDCCRVKCPTNLEGFLKHFDYFMPVIVGDPDAIERMAYEFCEDVANQKVLYCEARYCPHLLSTTYGNAASTDLPPLMPREVVICVNRGLSRGSADFRVTVRSILCCIRGHPEWSNEILNLCVEFKRQGVVGIDIAGDEADGLAAGTDIEVFQRAFSLGVHRTVHAAEEGPASNVQLAINAMYAERIGHGYHIVDDPDLYERAKNSGVHFETCPYSSCMTGSVTAKYPKHPIVRFAEDNVSFSINRDDPTVTQKTLDEEYTFLRELGLKEIHIVKANFNAASNCFLPPDEKERLLQQLRDTYEADARNIPFPVTCIPPKAMIGSGDA